MMDVKVKFINCPYCIDMDGQNVNKKVESKIINSLYEIKELALKIGEDKNCLKSLISLLETNLIRHPIAGWLETNSAELKNCIANLSELCILDTDIGEIKEIKSRLKTKLIELVES